MSVEEIEDHLKKQKELRDCPDDFISEIALQLHRYSILSIVSYIQSKRTMIFLFRNSQRS